MADRYITTKVNISDNQADKIKTAIHNSKGVTIQFSIEDLQVENPAHTLALTKGQLDKLAKALSEGVGVRITMSKTQLEHNKTIEGGFVFAPLVAGIASAVLPSLASFIMDKIAGKGIYMKRGGNIFKLKQMGDGLYLRPYKADNITGDGLYFKKGSSYELIKDGTINDIPLLNKL
jgi:hypothetical protein